MQELLPLLLYIIILTFIIISLTIISVTNILLFPIQIYLYRYILEQAWLWRQTIHQVQNAACTRLTIF